MLSPLTTTIISFAVVLVSVLRGLEIQIITYIEYEISSYYARKGNRYILVLVNSTFSFAVCLSILTVYVNDIYAFLLDSSIKNRLVYQGDLGVIRIMMSVMMLLYCLHTVVIVPLLAVRYLSL